MSHKRHRKPAGSDHQTPETSPSVLEIVLKADTRGTLEAIEHALAGADTGGVSIEVIERGVGEVSKGDLSMAVTGSRLVVGFDVGVLPRGDEYAREHGVEVRLYDVVSRLVEDLAGIARNLVQPPPGETVVAKARVVALFKSTRKGVILGCEVQEGRIALGMAFRVISAPGIVYVGKVQSLHIGEETVTQARPGQKVGLKIEDFKLARVGDLVECFEVARSQARPWTPRAGIERFSSPSL